MRPQDAEFVIGDWSKPHNLAVAKTEDPDIAVVSCTCGWRVRTGGLMADRMGKMHLNRAFDYSQKKRSRKTT